MKLFESFMRPNQELVAVKYFSAKPEDLEQSLRQNAFFQANKENSKFKLILGKCLKKEITCFRWGALLILGSNEIHKETLLPKFILYLLLLLYQMLQVLVISDALDVCILSFLDNPIAYRAMTTIVVDTYLEEAFAIGGIRYHHIFDKSDKIQFVWQL